MELILKILGIALAFSGWGKVLLDHRSNKPKIIGRVLNVMRGQMSNPENPTQHLTTFTTYLYLLNARKNLMHILDYEMEVFANGKWVRLKRVYGVHNIKNLNFLDPAGNPIKIERFIENLIYRKGEPAQQGIPLHGWIVFGGEESLYKSDILKYRLTCIDANLKKHKIQTNVKEFQNLYLLQEMAGIRFTNDSIAP